jgi:hypothetical protein
MKPSALLRTAAGLLFKGDINAPINHVYICFAIDAAVQLALNQEPAHEDPRAARESLLNRDALIESKRTLRKLILSRLEPYSTVGGYLREHVGVKSDELFSPVDVEFDPGVATTLFLPSPKLQEFRLAWMESLAQELETQGR